MSKIKQAYWDELEQIENIEEVENVGNENRGEESGDDE